MRATMVAAALACVTAACDRTSTEIHVDDLPRLALVQELRVGDVDDPDRGFSQIGGITVAADGRVFVLERLAREIRVFDSDGGRLYAFGRQGSGPGEFQGPGAFGIVGDTLWVRDAQNARITLFTLDGTLLATVPTRPVAVEVNAPGYRVQISASALRPDGRFSGTALVIPLAVVEQTPQPSAPQSIAIPELVFDATGAVVDTLGYIRRSTSSQAMVTVGSSTFGVPARPIPDDSVRILDSEDTLVVERPAATTGDENVFTVTRIASRGDTVFHLRLRYQPRPVDAAVRE